MIPRQVLLKVGKNPGCRLNTDSIYILSFPLKRYGDRTDISPQVKKNTILRDLPGQKIRGLLLIDPIDINLKTNALNDIG